MTLIEVVLAIAVAGFVLAGATAFLVSVSNIWHDRQNSHFFEDHVDGVSEFLKASFNMAGYEIRASEGNGATRENAAEGSDPTAPEQSPNAENKPPTPKSRTDHASRAEGSGGNRIETPIAWEALPGSAGYEDPLLSFSLTTAPPLLVGPDEMPYSKVQLFLHFKKQTD